MLLLSIAFIGLSIKVPSAAAPASKNCCAWRLDNHITYTDRIFDDFGRYPQVSDILYNPNARQLTSEWLIYDFPKKSDNPTTDLDERFEAQNVQLIDGTLILKQQGYSAADERARKPVRIAGIQSRAVDILHGSFRVVMKVTNDHGGTVSSFFWHSSDISEIDIEAITNGTSIVNNTINYTSHPSASLDGTPIPNATLSLPLNFTLSSYHEHRIDCDVTGAKYYLDGLLMHSDPHNPALSPGSIQLMLWANGNNYWSGRPSITDVFMSVKQIALYYNTTGDVKHCGEAEICAHDLPVKWDGTSAGSFDVQFPYPSRSRGSRVMPFDVFF